MSWHQLTNKRSQNLTFSNAILKHLTFWKSVCCKPYLRNFPSVLTYDRITSSYSICTGFNTATGRSKSVISSALRPASQILLGQLPDTQVQNCCSHFNVNFEVSPSMIIGEADSQPCNVEVELISFSSHRFDKFSLIHEILNEYMLLIMLETQYYCLPSIAVFSSVFWS